MNKQAMIRKLGVIVLSAFGAADNGGKSSVDMRISFDAPATQITQVRTSFKFDFGPGAVAPGYVQVLPATSYSRELGYGFEPGANVSCVERSRDALRGDHCTSEQPFYFSVALPEGNYNVTVIFGGAEAATTTTVKAELRRLMLEKVDTAPGKVVSRTFTVNIRRPQIAGGGEVRLKDRERAKRDLGLGRKADARIQQRASGHLRDRDHARGQRAHRVFAR